VLGQHVDAGQQLGPSGSAAGVSHLQFAQDIEHPAATLSVMAYVPYPEPWGEAGGNPFV